MTTSRSMTTAMLCAAAVSAQLVAAKATRDALFLTSLGVGALPTMLIVASICSILLVVAHARLAGRIAPAVLVPASFCVSGVLFLCEWFFRADAPISMAVSLYLHISAAGPLLASGFWLIASERFSPRTARKGFGRLAGAGTLGGLAGALLAERAASLAGVTYLLPCLAGLQFLAAGLVRILALSTPSTHPLRSEPPASPASNRSGLRVVAGSPRLRHLMALVLLGTTSAALLDYVFKVRAAETFGFGDTLLRFFALYYAGTNLVAFVLQVTASRAVLDRFGLALATSTPSIALLAGCAGALAAPGFGSIFVARGAESIFRGSWFRAGYELFYTPIPAAEKRAAKSFIDVAFDRLGDALGGGAVRLATLLVPAMQSSVLLCAAMAGSIGAIIAASHLNRWYLRALESSLLDRAGGIDFSETGDGSTTRVLRTVQRNQSYPTDAKTVVSSRTVPMPAPALSQEAQDILALQSGSRDEAIKVLFREDRLPAGLVAHVIPMLAREPVADFALFALRKVAEERVGQLTDALLDPNQDYAVRRRLARVFSVCVSQRATDALLLALDDPRFDVRFQSARSLLAIVEKNPRVQIPPTRIFDVVLLEAAVSRPVWESRRLLDGHNADSPLDEFVRDRASDSLAHVCTLLCLVMPKEPLQVAFRSLRTGDEHLRGTALEYLEGVLPAPIRERLWPFLVKRPSARPAHSYDEIVENLLRSSDSITLQALAGRGAKSTMAAC
jgi:hypothetical protein